MNDSPLLSKMDALLKKHRGGEAAEPAPPPGRTPPPGAWLPVLTDLIERGSPPAAAPAVQPPPAAAATASVPAAADTALADQLLCELAPRLSEAMEKQVSEELRKNLDQTLASVLSQLDINVRDLVRDAVAEKLRQPRDPAA